MTIRNLYPTIRPSLDLNFAKTKRIDPRVTFSRVSSGTYVGADGLIKTAVANEPRFDHDPATGQCKGLLIEESRVNIDPNSNTQPASTSTFLNSNISITTGRAAPRSGSTFRTFTPTSSTNQLRSYYSNPTSVVAGEAWCHSIYVDTLNSSAGTMIFSTGDTGSQHLTGFMTINPDKTISVSFPSAGQAHLATYTPISSGFQNCGNNIYRVWYVMSPVNTGSIYMGMGLYPSPDRPLGFSISVWGSQIEKGSFPTSYILTSGSTVTRSADVASIAGTNFSSWYNQSGGTWFGEVLSAYATGQRLFEVGNSSDNQYSVSVRPGSTFTSFARWASGANGVNHSYPAKFAVADSVTDIQGCVNGALANIVSTGNSVIDDKLVLGGEMTGTSSANSIARLTYWPTRLSDATLQSLTR